MEYLVRLITIYFTQLKFNPTGFILVLSASIFSGLRWSLTQILITSDTKSPNTINADQSNMAARSRSKSAEPSLSPLTTLYRLSPLMVVFFGIGSLVVESHDIYDGLSDRNVYWESMDSSAGILLLLVIGGVLALCMMFV
jgi:hypothetical protein